VSGSAPRPRHQARTRPSASPSGHGLGQRPGGVVDRRLLAAVVLVRAEELLGVLAEQAAPQAEVVGLVPPRLARRLEDTDGDHLVQPARVADLAGRPVMERERRGACRPVVAQGQRARRHRPGAPGEADRAAERGPVGAVAGRDTAPGGDVLKAGLPAGVDPVEEPAAAEGQPRAVALAPAGQVRLDEPVGGPVLEDRRRGERADHVAVALVPGAVRALRQRVRGEGRHVGKAGWRRLRTELQPDAVQRDRRGEPPGRRGEQRGAGQPEFGRVAGRGADRQIVAVTVQGGGEPEPPLF
jgi:hypothetical protein